MAAGREVVLTHGNGPQVGNLLVKNELAAAVVPPVPLDWCGAQTQGTIGAMLLNALDARSPRAGSTGRWRRWSPGPWSTPDDPGFRDAEQADRAVPARGRGRGA